RGNRENVARLECNSLALNDRFARPLHDDIDRAIGGPPIAALKSRWKQAHVRRNGWHDIAPVCRVEEFECMSEMGIDFGAVHGQSIERRPPFCVGIMK